MKNKTHTCRKIVDFLNNPEEEGGFWLPNIQRPFVWSEEQICRLFDSILREYPISTFLVWKTKNPIHRRKFIDNWRPSLKLSDFYVPEDDKKKCLVLDGQQRLQSLYIGLRGSYGGKELYLNILSGELKAPDDIKYEFKFIDNEKAFFPYVKFKDLIYTTKKKREIKEDIQNASPVFLEQEDIYRIEEALDLIDQTFKIDELITYQELDSIDNPNLYQEDDVVEIFIRANSGGTKLGKSDLLFSLLTSSWDQADQQMDDLLMSLNSSGFDFDRDFILKTCLTLLGQGAKYEISKFRKDGIKEDIEKNWKNISNAIKDVKDFIHGKTFIRCDKALPSYLVLIPLIYFRYHFPEDWKKAKKLDNYLIKSSLTRAFSSHSDNLINSLVKRIKDDKKFLDTMAFDIMKEQGRSLKLTEEIFEKIMYGTDTIHLLFNMWYSDFNYIPSYKNNLPQIDHIFPQSELKKIKIKNPKTGKPIQIYKKIDINQLANCMLLTQEENGAGGKGATLPKDWFSDKSSEYLSLHLIPTDEELWELDRFEDFIIARKKLILKKFKNLVSS